MRILLPFLVLALLSGCASKSPGPDQQFAGTLSGAATGAGAGAVTGFQLGAATGPSALAGAGLGAVAGGIQGFVKDQLEEDLLRIASETQHERSIAYAHELLNEHYKRRMELHPTRDIYPADLFFLGDGVVLRPEAQTLVSEIVQMNRARYPWSRFVIAHYVQAREASSNYALGLATRRCKELGDYFVRGGVDPRRIETRPVVVKEPVLIDPADQPDRYSQAIELIPLDR